MKIWITFLVLAFGASATVTANTSAKCHGESGYIFVNDRDRNPRNGGFVSDSAYVDDTVFIAETAAVCGSASVTDYARIYGNAVVRDEAQVSGKARVYGNAVIKDFATVEGDASVSQNAIIYGDAVINGQAVVRGYARINSGILSSGTHQPKEPSNEIAARESKKQIENLKSKFASLQESFSRVSKTDAYHHTYEPHDEDFIHKYLFTASIKLNNNCALDVKIGRYCDCNSEREVLHFTVDAAKFEIKDLGFEKDEYGTWRRFAYKMHDPKKIKNIRSEGTAKYYERDVKSGYHKKYTSFRTEYVNNESHSVSSSFLHTMEALKKLSDNARDMCTTHRTIVVD